VQLVAAGLNHKTAPVALREGVYLDSEECVKLLASMRASGVDGAAILSTCNRTEVYVASAGLQESRGQAAAFFRRIAPGARWPQLERSLYFYEGEEAARHLFAVAAGCNSLVVGEAQILGQVREALRVAARAGAAGPVITRLFDHAVRAARRVRSETPIGSGAVSVSHAAVELAGSLLGGLSGAAVLVIGAGKMAQAAARLLRARGAGRILVVNRTAARAEELARSVGGEAVPMERLGELLTWVDVVIASTRSKLPVVTAAAVAEAVGRRGGRSLYLIDIAVPRDVEPGAERVDGAFVYNVDDLRRAALANLAERRRWLPTARAIVEVEAARFWRWLLARRAAPMIAALRARVEGVVARELERALRGLDHLPEEEKEKVRSLARAVAGKILHAPTVKLKEAAERGSEAELFSLVAELFALDPGSAREAVEAPSASPRKEGAASL